MRSIEDLFDSDGNPKKGIEADVATIIATNGLCRERVIRALRHHQDILLQALYVDIEGRGAPNAALFLLRDHHEPRFNIGIAALRHMRKNCGRRFMMKVAASQKPGVSIGSLFYESVVAGKREFAQEFIKAFKDYGDADAFYKVLIEINEDRDYSAIVYIAKDSGYNLKEILGCFKDRPDLMEGLLDTIFTQQIRRFNRNTSFHDVMREGCYNAAVIADEVSRSPQFLAKYGKGELQEIVRIAAFAENQNWVSTFGALFSALRGSAVFREEVLGDQDFVDEMMRGALRENRPLIISTFFEAGAEFNIARLFQGKSDKVNAFTYGYLANVSITPATKISAGAECVIHGRYRGQDPSVGSKVDQVQGEIDKRSAEIVARRGLSL